MDINHIVIFEDGARMNITIDEHLTEVLDVTLMNMTPETKEIMNLIAHKDLERCERCLTCVKDINKYAQQVIDILKNYK